MYIPPELIIHQLPEQALAEFGPLLARVERESTMKRRRSGG